MEDLASRPMTDNNGGLQPHEVEVFARGLYFLADQDGIDETEEKLIRDFLEESGTDLRYEAIRTDGFSASEAARMLETTYLRRIFLKAAVALVKADGVYSDKEREALGQFADAFGLSNAEFGAIEQEANDLRID